MCSRSTRGSTPTPMLGASSTRFCGLSGCAAVENVWPAHNYAAVTTVTDQQCKVASQELPFLSWEEPYLADIKANLAELQLEHQHNWEEEHPDQDPCNVRLRGTAWCVHLMVCCSGKGLHLTAGSISASAGASAPDAAVHVQGGESPMTPCAGTTPAVHESLAAHPQCCPASMSCHAGGTGTQHGRRAAILWARCGPAAQWRARGCQRRPLTADGQLCRRAHGPAEGGAGGPPSRAPSSALPRCCSSPTPPCVVQAGVHPCTNIIGHR